mmetsp:Transcript_16702/g.25505  ORF Transcript_16702/g.25505 Transcript_16702/m.25505 type:complete len:159 (-) Transcript_16702:1120-1596(-)
MGFEVPHTLSVLSAEADARYGHATQLRGALRSYAQIRGAVSDGDGVLVGQHLAMVREAVGEAFPGDGPTTARRADRRVRWDSPKFADWAEGLTGSVHLLQERVEELSDANREVARILDDGQVSLQRDIHGKGGGSCSEKGRRAKSRWFLKFGCVGEGD